MSNTIIATWGKIGKDEINEIEKIQRRAFKKMLNLPISTSYIGLIMETGKWPDKQRIQYTTMMLYHNIMNNDHNMIRKDCICGKWIATIKGIILTQNAHYVKNQKTPHSMCWNMKKLKGSPLIKKTTRENGKR